MYSIQNVLVYAVRIKAQMCAGFCVYGVVARFVFLKFSYKTIDLHVVFINCNKE